MCGTSPKTSRRWCGPGSPSNRDGSLTPTARWTSPRDSRRERRSGRGGGDQDPALGFGEAAPDPVLLADAEGVIEALAAHRAHRADRFGLALAGVAVVLALRVRRREEEGTLRSPARRLQLPRPVLDDPDGHGPPLSLSARPRERNVERSSR